MEAPGRPHLSVAVLNGKLYLGPTLCECSSLLRSAGRKNSHRCHPGAGERNPKWRKRTSSAVAALRPSLHAMSGVDP